MGTELGKWLMDVAKYIFTAVLLSAAFGDLTRPFVLTVAIWSVFITLLVGLILVESKKEK